MAPRSLPTSAFTALGRFADRLGLGDALSARVPWTGERAAQHDRGKLLVQSMLMLAGGGECCADIEHLRAQDALFGRVPSGSFQRIDAEVLSGLWEAMAETRALTWSRMGATTGTSTVVLDVDASLVQIHSENKHGSASNYKRGFEFHPIFCFADATGEALAALLRAGNATSNDSGDNLAVLDAAIAQLPLRLGIGHRAGDHASTVARALMVRSDSAGCTPGSSTGAGTATSGSPSWPAATPASTPASRPLPPTTTAGSQPYAKTVTSTPAPRSPSSPTSSTATAGRTGPGSSCAASHSTKAPRPACSPPWSGATGATGPTRPAHPPTSTPTCALTPTSRTTSADSRTPASNGFPFADLDANRAWMALVCWSDTLVRWFQKLVLTGPWPQPSPSGCAGRCGTHPPASSDPDDDTSCGSSTTGPPPASSSTPTGASTSSPDPTGGDDTQPFRDTLGKPAHEPTAAHRTNRETTKQRATDRSHHPIRRDGPNRPRQHHHADPSPLLMNDRG